MDAMRIQTGSVEPLATFAVNNAGAPLTGLANLHFRLRRFSDGFWFDFNDSTFKTNGSVTTLDSAALTEVDATDVPGLYELASGFDFSSITNPTAGPTTEENYFIIPVQVGASNANLPVPSEVREGGFVDRIDATLSDIETDTQDIQSRLPAALVSGRMDSDVGNMQTDTVDANALATSGVNEIRDSILADSTAFNGADIPAILADTADMQPKIGVPVTSVSADIAAVKGDTAAILLDTAAIDSRLPSDPADQSLLEAEHAQTQADIAALNDLSAQAVRDAQKLAPTVGAPAVGSVDEHLDDILADTAAIDARLPVDPADESLQQAAHTQTQTDIAAVKVDTAAIDSRLPSDPADESLQQASHTQTQADIAAVKVDTAAILLDTAAIDARLPSDPADESLQQASHAQTQADIAALNNLSDQAIRDAMKLAPTVGVPAVGSVDEHLDDILTDTSAIDARLPSDPADESLQQAAHAQTQADIAALNDLAQSDILSDATPFPGANIDATISSRSDFDETADPVEILDSGGTAGTSAAELVTDIEADLAANHGAGQWDGTDSDWTSAEREQIRFRLALDGVQTDPTTGVGTLEAVLADTDAIDTRLPADPADESLQQDSHTQTQADIAALNDLAQSDILSDATPFPGADIDAAISSRSSHSAADVEALNVAAHGAGPHTTATGFAVPADVATAHGITNALVASEHASTDALVAAVPAVTESLNAAAHGAGSHVTATGFSTHSAADAADAAWDEPAGDHVVPGSMGEAQGQGAAASKIDSVATLDPSLAVTGSLLDRIANRDGAKTFDQSTDSLEASRDRIG